MKKVLLLSAGFLWSLNVACAQTPEYKVKLANSKEKRVVFELAGSTVKIEGYNGSEVIIQASSGIEAPPDRAKGLKPLYYSAVDNSGIGLSVTPDASGLKIEKATRQPVKYTVKLPRQVAVKFVETNWMGGSGLSVANMDGDLEIKTNNANITLSNITGPVVANTTSGEITATFSTLAQGKPTAISSISGEVDITLPATAKANLQLRSINGEMYTDFDLGVKNSKDGMSRVGGMSNVDGSINGGGVEMSLNTISSNIYIRKQK